MYKGKRLRPRNSFITFRYRKTLHIHTITDYRINYIFIPTDTIISSRRTASYSVSIFITMMSRATSAFGKLKPVAALQTGKLYSHLDISIVHLLKISYQHQRYLMHSGLYKDSHSDSFTILLPTSLTSAAKSATSVSGDADNVNDRMIWVDLEMSGLEVSKERIIEMAVCVTDSKLTKIAEVNFSGLSKLHLWSFGHSYNSQCLNSQLLTDYTDRCLDILTSIKSSKSCLCSNTKFLLVFAK